MIKLCLTATLGLLPSLNCTSAAALHVKILLQLLGIAAHVMYSTDLRYVNATDGLIVAAWSSSHQARSGFTCHRAKYELHVPLAVFICIASRDCVS